MRLSPPIYTLAIDIFSIWEGENMLRIRQLLAVVALALAAACDDNPTGPGAAQDCTAQMAARDMEIRMTPHTRTVTSGSDAAGQWERWAITWGVEGLAPISMTFRWGGATSGCVMEYGAA